MNLYELINLYEPMHFPFADHSIVKFILESSKVHWIRKLKLKLICQTIA